MSAPAPTAYVLRFDMFELDIRAGQLRKRAFPAQPSVASQEIGHESKHQKADESG
jgi:hypothetical protein